MEMTYDTKLRIVEDLVARDSENEFAMEDACMAVAIRHYEPTFENPYKEAAYLEEMFLARHQAHSTDAATQTGMYDRDF